MIGGCGSRRSWIGTTPCAYKHTGGRHRVGSVLSSAMQYTLVENNMPQATLDTPIERSALERFCISALASVMQSSFRVLTFFFDSKHNRLKLTLDTGATGYCKLFIYLPKFGVINSRRGVVVHLHGSGWTVGCPEFEHRSARRMADTLGVAVVSPDYAKAPQHPYPFAIFQIYAVLEWISLGGLKSRVSNADGARIALSGGSAGGNIAASLVLLIQSRPLPNDSQVVALGMLYPHVDAVTPYNDKLKRMRPQDAKALALPQWTSKFFMHAYLPHPRARTDPFVSPLFTPREMLARFPPTVIVTAEIDYLAHEGEEFGALLQDTGANVRVVTCPAVKHAFDLEPALPIIKRKQSSRNRCAAGEAWGAIIESFTTAFDH